VPIKHATAEFAVESIEGAASAAHGDDMDKTVKGATKIKVRDSKIWQSARADLCFIKLAAPKSKYVEAILSATHGGEAGIAEVFRTLQLRLRDSTWTIVFKALIIVHLMIREGQPDLTLRYIAESPKRLAISNFTDGMCKLGQERNTQRRIPHTSARGATFLLLSSALGLTIRYTCSANARRKYTGLFRLPARACKRLSRYQDRLCQSRCGKIEEVVC
jgi:hypothetical protein